MKAPDPLHATPIAHVLTSLHATAWDIPLLNDVCIRSDGCRRGESGESNARRCGHCGSALAIAMKSASMGPYASCWKLAVSSVQASRWPLMGAESRKKVSLKVDVKRTTRWEPRRSGQPVVSGFFRSRSGSTLPASARILNFR